MLRARPYPELVARQDRVVVVEDDAVIGRTLSDALERQGYATEWVTTGADALQLVGQSPPDLVLLDLGLPDLDGVEVCRRLRALEPALTIVILTARRDEIDVVVGLDSGADDYITKPFRLVELLARVRAHLRRPRSPVREARVEVGDVEVDVDARRVWVAGSEIELRPREFDLLVLLVSEAGNALSRERIMTEVWDEHWFGSVSYTHLTLPTNREV